jgi:hypothetical protein
VWKYNFPKYLLTQETKFVRAGPEVWVAQARPDVGCPLLLNIKKMQNQGYNVFFSLNYIKKKKIVIRVFFFSFN